MRALERLERAKGGPFVYRVNGQTRGLSSPADMTPFEVLDRLDQGTFAIPGLTLDQGDRLFAAWCAHFDLPDFGSARRLAYLVDRYDAALEFDLRVHAAGADLGELWRARRWRTLLNLIDHLPSHTYYAEAVSNDEEHADMIAKAEAARRENGQPEEKWTPPLRSWTPEMGKLTEILDAVRGLNFTLIAVNSEKGKAGQPPPPSPRPMTAIDKARKRADYHRRLESHKSLVARMLPKKAQSAD